jgi:hypothetical protein
VVAVIRNGAAALSAVAVPGLWLQRAPHWSIAFAALAFALWSSSRRRFWLGMGVFGVYVALWAASPVDAHRSFQLAVLRTPGMDCHQYDACSKGAVEWSHRVYGDEVDG